METSHTVLKFEKGYDYLSIISEENEENNEILLFKLKNVFEPFYWEFKCSYKDLTGMDKIWSRFYDISEIFAVLSEKISENELKLIRNDETLIVSFVCNFNKTDINYRISLKPEGPKDMNILMADFGKIILNQQAAIDNMIEKFKKVPENSNVIMSQIEKSSNGLKSEINDQLVLLKKENTNGIQDLKEKNDKLFQEQEKKNILFESNIPEIYKLSFNANNQLNIAATSYTNYGTQQTFTTTKKGCYVKWTLELKNVYSNTYNFFHRLRLYFTGPQNLYVPDENYGILHEWFQNTYGQYINIRETGIFELSNEGAYTVYLQGLSSNGNYMYITNPMLYLEIVKK